MGFRPFFGHAARAVAAGLLLLGLATPALAQERATAPAASMEAVEKDPQAALSRLSDTEVRKLLLQYMQDKDNQEAAAFNPADMAMATHRRLERIRGNAARVFGAWRDLPGELAEAWQRFAPGPDADARVSGAFRNFEGAPAPGAAGRFAFLLLASLALAGALEYAVRHRLGASGFYTLRPAERFPGRLAALFWRLAVAAGHTTLFCAAAAFLFLLIGHDSPDHRTTFAFYLTAIAIARMLFALLDALFSPGRPEVRMPSYGDAEARRLRDMVAAAAVIGTFGFFTCAVLRVYGIDGPGHTLLVVLTGSATVALLALALVLNRRALSADILATGSPAGRLRRTVAPGWPWVAAVLLVAVWVGSVVAALAGARPLPGAGVVTVFLILVIPILDAALAREAAHETASEKELRAALYSSVRIVLLVAVLLVLATFWRVGPTAAAADGPLALLATAGFKIAISVMLAWLLWNAVRIWVDRRIAEEEAAAAALSGHQPGETEIGGTGQTRMRTLLPLFRFTFQVTIAVIAGMIVLSSLGINIAPVLAGAGVVGIAVGFGSQTLVRDIVSGAFFLMDDAFRLGEYVDLGDVKGTVERISLRSFQLRHHRGAVNTVPFGEIKVLKNFSRDWAIMKLRFRVSFDTDLDKVRKIMKQVGKELLENEEIREDFIEPFKSQGVLEVDDYGFVVRAKFTAKPGKQFLIRRYAYQAVQKAFADNGIEFAKPEVRVVVGGEDEEDRDVAGRAAGAAVQIEAAKRLQQARSAEPAAE